MNIAMDAAFDVGAFAATLVIVIGFAWRFLSR